MKYYLAYGSNLNLSQMQQRCPDAVLVGRTKLESIRLIYRGSGTGFYLSIEPNRLGHSHRFTPCGVFRISDRDERRLDVYEGWPRFYKKIEIEHLLVDDMNGKPLEGELTGMAYILPTSTPVGLPSKYYVDTCKQGYKDFGFDTQRLDDALQDTKEEMYK